MEKFTDVEMVRCKTGEKKVSLQVMASSFLLNIYFASDFFCDKLLHSYRFNLRYMTPTLHTENVYYVLA